MFSAENNKITGIPSSLCGLTYLRTVNLSGNQITSFPGDLSQLKQLDALNLSRNRITVLPESISTCQAIEINLNQNQVCKSSCQAIKTKHITGTFNSRLIVSKTSRRYAPCCMNIVQMYYTIWFEGVLILWVFLVIFQSYCNCQFDWWRKPGSTRRKPPTCNSLKYQCLFTLT